MSIDADIFGLVFDIKKFAIYDGEGIRTTIFLKGCSLNCVWCQNPEGKKSNFELFYDEKKCIQCNRCVSSCPVYKLLPDRQKRVDREKDCLNNCDSCYSICPTEAIYKVGKLYSTAKLLEIILKDLPFYRVSHGGVTFSGGEPMLQISFLKKIIGKLNKKGITVYIETCGDVPWDYFDTIIEKVNHFYYDIKLINSSLHEKYTGKGNKQILDNILHLAKRKKEITIRVPLIPNVTDTEENIKDVIHFIVNNNLASLHVELLPFNTLAAVKYKRTGINTVDIGPFYSTKATQQDKEVVYRFKSLFTEKGIKTKILSFE